jgi:hypothetical protein
MIDGLGFGSAASARAVAFPIQSVDDCAPFQ